jgi:hypothetical protein
MILQEDRDFVGSAQLPIHRENFPGVQLISTVHRQHCCVGTSEIKQTEKSLHAQVFSFVAESRRNSYVAPSFSGTQLRNPS